MNIKPLSSRRVRIMFALLIGLIMLIGLVILPIEKKFGNLTTFTTAEDGVWWAITTVTGVGYGDYYPVTTVGRILGVILETIGVMFFGMLIALVTINLFRKEQQFYWKRTVERFDRIEEKLDKLKKEQGFALKNGGEKKE